MTTGKIKTIINKDDKQFGFITAPGQAGDTYFSPKGLVAGLTLETLKVDDVVTFEAATDPTTGRVSATNVQLAGAKSDMAEAPAASSTPTE